MAQYRIGDTVKLAHSQLEKIQNISKREKYELMSGTILAAQRGRYSYVYYIDWKLPSRSKIRYNTKSWEEENKLAKC